MDSSQNSTWTRTSGGEEIVADTPESHLSQQNNRGNSDGRYLQGALTDTVQRCTNKQIHGGTLLETEERRITLEREEELEQTPNDLTVVTRRLRQDATMPISPYPLHFPRPRRRSLVIQFTNISSRTGLDESNYIFDLTPASAIQLAEYGTTLEAPELEEQISTSGASPNIPWPHYEWFPPSLFNDPTTTFDVFKAFDSSILVGAGQFTESLNSNETQPDTPVEDVPQIDENGVDPTSAFYIEPSLTQHTFALLQQRRTEGYNWLAEIWSEQPGGTIPEPEEFDNSDIPFADQVANNLPSNLQNYLEEHLTEVKNVTGAMENEGFQVQLAARGWEYPGDGYRLSLSNNLEEHSAQGQPTSNRISQTSQQHSAETQGEYIGGDTAQRAASQLGDMWTSPPVPYIQSMSLAQIAAIPTDHIVRPDPEHIRRTIMYYEQNVFFPMPAHSDYSSRQYYMTAEYHGLTREQTIGRNSYLAITDSSNRVMTGNSAGELGERSSYEDRERSLGVNGRGRMRGRGRGRGGMGRAY